MSMNSNIVSRRVLRVLIADDSGLVQEFLREILDEEPDMLVVGVAQNGEEVLAQAQSLRPDLITMDVHMPRLDGVTATRRIMAECPTPIAIVTAAPVGPDSEIAFEAMAAGAVEALAKPKRNEFLANPAHRDAFVRQLRNVAYVKVVGIRGQARREHIVSSVPPRRQLPPLEGGTAIPHFAPQAIGIGASTGGPPALRTVLSRLDAATCPPVLVVQHMSAEFLPGFATWLDGVVAPRVEIARSGAPLRPGTVYVAAGEKHLVVSRGRIGLVDRAPVQFQRPSADVLFESLAESYGNAAIGVLLTGMGRDGADGLRKMQQRGALTIAQDESSSLVYGMPRAAVELQAARIVTNPEHISQMLRQFSWSQESETRRTS